MCSDQGFCIICVITVCILVISVSVYLTVNLSELISCDLYRY